MASNWDRVGDYLAQQRQPASWAQQLGGSLGYLLGGGPKRDAEAAYTARMGDLLALGLKDQQMQQAVLKTAALNGLGDALSGFGYTPEQAAAAATLGRAGLNPEQYTGARGDLQAQGFHQDAVDAGRRGDWAGANGSLLGVANGPVQLATIEGQNLIGNRLVPGGGSVATTEQGRASMEADAARARASDASAASSRASAQATLGRLRLAQRQFELQRQGKWNPSGSAIGGSGGSYTAPSQTSMMRMLGDTITDAYGQKQTVLNPDKAQDFELWRRAHPEYRNGEEALAAYNAEASGSGVHIIDPSMPGSMTISPPALPRPSSKAEYDALPSGTQFVAPDGSMRIKP